MIAKPVIENQGELFLRKKVVSIMQKMKHYIPQEYFHIHDALLKKLYNSIEAPPDGQNANVMYDIFNFKPCKVIGLEQIVYFNNTIHKMVMGESKPSRFTEKLKKEYALHLKEKFKKTNNLLTMFQSYVDVPHLIEQCLVNAISYSDEIVAYKFERVLGMSLLDKLGVTGSFIEVMHSDLTEVECQKFIINEIKRPTPKVVELTHFNRTATCIKEKKLATLMVIKLLLEDVKRIQLWLPELKENLEDLILPMRYIVTLLNLYNEGQEQIPKIALRKLKYRLLNIKNVYVKQLGMEATQLLCDSSILMSYKKNNILHYKLASKLTFIAITHRMPELWLEPENKQSSQTYNKCNTLKNENTLGVLPFNNQILNDNIEGTVKDFEHWYDSQGALTINLDFVKEFLKNLMYIMKKVKQNAGLNQAQNLFLKHYIGYDFEYLKHAGDADKLYKKVLQYAFNFKDLSQKKFYHQEIPQKIMLAFTNKIYQRKFFLLQIITDLPIMLSFSDWKMLMKFCARGRGYPSPSLFNHTIPITKHFLGFSSKYQSVVDLEQINLAIQEQINALVNEEQIRSLHTAKKLTRGLRLIDLVHLKKPFESYLLFKDIILMRQPNYRFQYYYSLDACGSGIQVNALLVKSKKIGVACGLVNSDEAAQEPHQDFYTKFVVYLQDVLKRKQTSNLLYSIPQTILTAAKTFVDKYIDAFSTDLILSLFTNKEALSSFLDLYNSIDNNVELAALIKFKKRYRSKIKIREIYKFLVDNKLVHKPRKKKYVTLQNLINPQKPVGIVAKLSYIFAVFKMIRLEGILIAASPYSILINRKMVRNPIMTYFYGSSVLTRCKSYEDSFVEQCIDAKILINKADIMLFRTFATYIDHQLRKWIKNTLPEARIQIF